MKKLETTPGPWSAINNVYAVRPSAALSDLIEVAEDIVEAFDAFETSHADIARGQPFDDNDDGLVSIRHLRALRSALLKAKGEGK